MYNESKNPKVIQSLDLLADALQKRMEQESFSRITVRSICQLAGVSTKTFYRNCLVKEDLIDYLCSRKIHALFETVQWNSSDGMLLFSNFLSFWKAEAEFLKLLIRHDLFSRLQNQLIRLSIAEADYPFLSLLLKDQNNPQTIRRFHTVFSISGLCAVLEEWCRQDFAAPLPVIAKLLADYVRAESMLQEKENPD